MVHSIIYLFIYSFIHLFVCLFVYWFILTRKTWIRYKNNINLSDIIRWTPFFENRSLQLENQNEDVTFWKLIRYRLANTDSVFSRKCSFSRYRYVAATHFEPTGARLAFPCWDEPAIKAPFEITIINSASYKAVISNMKETNKTVANGMLTTTFNVTPPMSTYLVAFVVSDYESNEHNSSEMLFRVWTKPRSISQTKYALSVGQQLLEKMEDYTDIKFSRFIPKMDQVSLRDFSAGAMENWGLVTYR